MREVISLNGMTPQRARALTTSSSMHPIPMLILTFHAYSRPSWLPDCKFMLGGEFLTRILLSRVLHFQRQEGKILLMPEVEQRLIRNPHTALLPRTRHSGKQLALLKLIELL